MFLSPNYCLHQYFVDGISLTVFSLMASFVDGIQICVLSFTEYEPLELKVPSTYLFSMHLQRAI